MVYRSPDRCLLAASFLTSFRRPGNSDFHTRTLHASGMCRVQFEGNPAINNPSQAKIQTRGGGDPQGRGNLAAELIRDRISHCSMTHCSMTRLSE